MVQIAGTLIVLALACYSYAVFSSRKSLELHHAIWFAIGLVFDLVGTGLMFYMAGWKFPFNLHTVLGIVALVIMAVHALWAWVAYGRHSVHALGFHRYSRLAYCLWVMAFLSGVCLSMLSV